MFAIRAGIIYKYDQNMKTLNGSEKYSTVHVFRENFITNLYIGVPLNA
jgi:hypothetical protein